MTANPTLKETRKQMFAEFERKLLEQRPPEDAIFYLYPDEEHMIASQALFLLMTRTATKQHSRLKNLLLLRQYQEEMLKAWITESPNFPNEEVWELLDGMDFEQNKVRCRKIEQMLPKLKKLVEEEMRMM